MSIYYIAKVTGGHLEPIKSSVGVKQGEVLSQLLFNHYIDDIKTIFKDSCDPVLISTSQLGLNNCLDK